MNAQEIIERIRTAEKKTPVRVFLKAREPVEFPHATVFPCGETTLVFGDWKDIGPVLEEHKGDIQELVVENDSRNSAIPLLDKRTVNARIEPGAILREQVDSPRGGERRRRRGDYDGRHFEHWRCGGRGYHD